MRDGVRLHTPLAYAVRYAGRGLGWWVTDRAGLYKYVGLRLRGVRASARRDPDPPAGADPAGCTREPPSQISKIHA